MLTNIILSFSFSLQYYHRTIQLVRVYTDTAVVSETTFFPLGIPTAKYLTESASVTDARRRVTVMLLDKYCRYTVRMPRGWRFITSALCTRKRPAPGPWLYIFQIEI